MQVAISKCLQLCNCRLQGCGVVIGCKVATAGCKAAKSCLGRGSARGPCKDLHTFSFLTLMLPMQKVDPCLLLQVPGELVFAKHTVYSITCTAIVPYETQPKVLKVLSLECISQVHPDFVEACIQHAFSYPVEL
jgi:hypothetical protein